MRVVQLCRATLLALRAAGREGGQAAVEYLLATGLFAGVVALVFIAAAELAVPAVLEFACEIVDPLGDGSCFSL